MHRFLRYSMMGIAAWLASSILAQTRVEYFWDTDPGVGKATLLKSSAEETIALEQSIPTSSLQKGIHQLVIRAVNASVGQPCYVTRSVLVTEEKTETIQEVEYYWDTDPGLGKGTAIPFTASDYVALNTTLSCAGLADGSHQLNIRARSGTAWSTVYSTTVIVETIESNELSLLEYFWDEDPGVGKGKVITVPAGQQGVPFAIDLNTADLPGGVHQLGLRSKAGDNWSQTETRTFLIDNEGLVARMEYFWDDEDPGIGNAIPLDVEPAHEIRVTDLVLPLTGLSYEYHTLNIRAMSESEVWTEAQRIRVKNVNPEGEYSIDMSCSEGGTVTASAKRVDEGKPVTFTFTPDIGHELYRASVNGVDIMPLVADNKYTINGVTDDILLSAEFKPQVYAVEISCGSNGTVTADSETIAYGQSVTFTITPNEGYKIEEVLCNGTDVTNMVKDGKYTVANVQGVVRLSVTFKIEEFNVAVVCGEGGHVTSSAQLVNYGESVTFTITPDEGRAIQSVILNGADVTKDVVGGQYTVYDVRSDVVLTVTFGIGDIAMAISCSVGCRVQVNDDMLDAGEHGKLIPYGSNVTIRLCPDQGYQVASVTINGEDITSEFEDNVFVLRNVTEHKSIKVEAIRSSYQIEVIQSEGGTLLASSTTVVLGGSVTFTLLPDEGYEVVSVIMNGENITDRFVNDMYTLESVRTDISIQATFAAQSADAVSTAHARVATVERVKDGILVKNAPVGKLLNVYTMAGIPVKSIKISEADFYVKLPSDKVYIIKIADWTFKMTR